jgi:hypothetical protein
VDVTYVECELVRVNLSRLNQSKSSVDLLCAPATARSSHLTVISSQQSETVTDTVTPHAPRCTEKRESIMQMPSPTRDSDVCRLTLTRTTARRSSRVTTVVSVRPLVTRHTLVHRPSTDHTEGVSLSVVACRTRSTDDARRTTELGRRSELSQTIDQALQTGCWQASAAPSTQGAGGSAS